MCSYVYDMLHILLYCDSLKDLWNVYLYEYKAAMLQTTQQYSVAVKSHPSVTSVYLLFDCLRAVTFFSPLPHSGRLWAPDGCLSDEHRIFVNSGCGEKSVQSNTRLPKELRMCRATPPRSSCTSIASILRKGSKLPPNVMLSEEFRE
jgi:hypothetical protein